MDNVTVVMITFSNYQSKLFASASSSPVAETSSAAAEAVPVAISNENLLSVNEKPSDTQKRLLESIR